MPRGGANETWRLGRLQVTEHARQNLRRLRGQIVEAYLRGDMQEWVRRTQEAQAVLTACRRRQKCEDRCIRLPSCDLCTQRIAAPTQTHDPRD